MVTGVVDDKHSGSRAPRLAKRVPGNPSPLRLRPRGGANKSSLHDPRSQRKKGRAEKIALACRKLC
jgi:hypothetical protein